jgi:hypothetical protein
MAASALIHIFISDLYRMPDDCQRRSRSEVALDDHRPLSAFAGIWTEFRGDRGTKPKPVPRPHNLRLPDSLARSSNRSILKQAGHPDDRRRTGRLDEGVFR